MRFGVRRLDSAALLWPSALLVLLGGLAAGGCEEGAAPLPDPEQRRAPLLLPASAATAAAHGFPTLGPARRLACPFVPEALRFSPDGSRLLASGPKLRDLAVVDLAGGPPRLVASEPGAGAGMLWSPDGREVLYRVHDPDAPGDRLRAVAADGSTAPLTLAAAPRLGYPALLPDGRVALTWDGALVAFPPGGGVATGSRSGTVGGAQAGGLLLPGSGAPGSGLVPQGEVPAAGGLLVPAGAQPLLGHLQGLRVAIAGGDPAVAFVDHGRFILRAPLVTDWMAGRRVPFSGDSFFLGEASPDGRHVIVHESRGAHGHFHVVGATGAVEASRRDLGPGHDATWAGPDVVVFAVLEHDGRRLTRSDLWVVHVASGERRPLRTGSEAIEHRPAADPRGRTLAWVDRADGGLYVGELSWPEVER